MHNPARWIWLMPMGAALSGCLLADFENGPAPPLPDGSVPFDAGKDTTPAEDVVESDTQIQPDVVDEPDAIQTEAGFCEANGDGVICGPGDACSEMVCMSGDCVVLPIPESIPLAYHSVMMNGLPLSRVQRSMRATSCVQTP